ncbi:MAG: hypothetical protein AB7V48_17260 [Sedimentibacter sp.]
MLGATGSSKTYLSTALDMSASRSFYTVKYVRLPEQYLLFTIVLFMILIPLLLVVKILA